MEQKRIFIKNPIAENITWKIYDLCLPVKAMHASRETREDGKTVTINYTFAPFRYPDNSGVTVFAIKNNEDRGLFNDEALGVMVEMYQSDQAWVTLNYDPELLGKFADALWNEIAELFIAPKTLRTISDHYGPPKAPLRQLQWILVANARRNILYEEPEARIDHFIIKLQCDLDYPDYPLTIKRNTIDKALDWAKRLIETDQKIPVVKEYADAHHL